ncbi:MAG: hypothetical protein ACQETL_15480 [Bacteroidota bacterium]
MNKIKNLTIFIFLIPFIFSCQNENLKKSYRKLSNKDFAEILDGIEIPKRDYYRIFISVEEYLNDSTLIISIYQHGVKNDEIEQLKPFNYKGMETFISYVGYTSWVPDSYYKKLMVQISECYFNYYELKTINSAMLSGKNCVIDSTDAFDVEEIL